MSRRDWLRVLVLILVPVNAWLVVFYYLHRQRQAAIHAIHDPKQLMQERAVFYHHSRKKLNLQIGQRLNIPYPSTFVGFPPPFQQGYPVCFIYISGLARSEVWEPAVLEALNASPYLYVVLLHPAEGDWAPIKQMVQRINNPRLSILMGNWVHKVFGSYGDGILLVLCDGNGVIRAIEPYPNLKRSPSLEEEIADWRPKLHRAVKKMLDEFFPKRPQ